MLRFLPGWLRGSLSLLLYSVNTIFWAIPLFSMAILKFLIPIRPFRDFCSRILVEIAFLWILVNIWNQKLFLNLTLEVEGLEKLNRRDWYLVIANHQTWVDILVLQRIFYRRIPFLKFFLKKELIWVPILGLAWWALDFPFMKRYSSDFLKKYPHLKGRDIEITRRACKKFSTSPVSVVNFLEGTRFTEEKREKQQSPYTHLLLPRAGGIAFVLAAMGEQLNNIVNVTIAYPARPVSFWRFLCGKVAHIKVTVEIIPITGDLIGDYFEDDRFRESFQQWVNTLWEDKDHNLSRLQLVN